MQQRPTTGEMFVNGVGQGQPFVNRIFRTIWDGNGIDTYDFSNYITNLNIDLTPGSWVDLDVTGNFQRANLGGGSGGGFHPSHARAHVFNALQFDGDPRSLIENAIGGSGNDVITGNSGTNTLDGGAGADDMDGGDGNDIYIVDNPGDIVKEAFDDDLGGTADTVLASVSYSLAPGTSGHQGFGIENLALTGSANINAMGNAKGNLLIGNSGANTLDGGAGADDMDGGDGNDTLKGGAGIDNLTGGKGNDRALLHE
jgi:serralysin